MSNNTTNTMAAGASPHEMLPVAKAAKRLGLVYKMIERGDLKAVRMGDGLRISGAEIARISAPMEGGK